MIVSEKLGSVPVSKTGMVVAIRQFLVDDGMRGVTADRAREFVLANYAPVAVARSYENLLGTGSPEG